MQIKIRAAKPEDINFIYSTWLRCYKHDSPITKYVKRDMFFDEHQKLLDGLLTHVGVKVAIACEENDEDLIFGFLAYEPKIVHFVYIKEPFRKMGIAKKLITHEGIDLTQCQASHLTYGLLDLWTAQVTSIEFNPYLLRRDYGRKEGQ